LSSLAGSCPPWQVLVLLGRLKCINIVCRSCVPCVEVYCNLSLFGRVHYCCLACTYFDYRDNYTNHCQNSKSLHNHNTFDELQVERNHQ
jgi:hypothetical protein